MIKKNIISNALLVSAVILLTLVSCDRSSEFEQQEALTIQEYLESNPTLAYVLQPSGLYYYSIKPGTGLTPVTHDTAWVKYTGKFLNGEVFDSNVGTTNNDTLIFPVNEGWVIAGVDEAITLMKVGEKAMFLLPSKLAYGPSGFYIIGGYTPLLFDLELLKVKRGPAK